jgi:hypothetical protein
MDGCQGLATQNHEQQRTPAATCAFVGFRFQPPHGPLGMGSVPAQLESGNVPVPAAPSLPAIPGEPLVPGLPFGPDPGPP